MEGRKLRCKPGDWVIVVGGDPEFVGRTFQVTEIAFGQCWNTQPHQCRASIPDVIVAFVDSTLQPLRPDESPEGIVTDEPVEVVA